MGAPVLIRETPDRRARSPDITVTLPGEPRGKGRPRSRIVSTSGGRQFISVYTDSETRSYEGMLRLAAAQAMQHRPPIQRAMRVVVTAIFSVPLSWSGKRRREAISGLIRPSVRPDVDNLLKTLDALNGVVWRDDGLIVECTISKHYGDAPSLQVEVWEHTGLLL